MKKTILTLAMAMALVGFTGPATSMAATSKAPHQCVSTPTYTGYINVHKVKCPLVAKPGQTPRLMGTLSF